MRTEKENGILGNIDASANLAVKDLAVARKFYEGTLGLTQVGSEGDGLIVYRSGKTTLNVYRSDEAGTNKAAALTWAIGDRVEEFVRALAGKGVKLEHSDIAGMTREGDVHICGDMKVIWFKDQDGNILNISSR